MGLDLHVRQILEKELDIISGRKVVCLCCFYNAVDHCAGLCAGRRVAEQPVLSADSMEAFLHELTHAYCHWLETKDRKFPMDCQLGQCENQNVQLGYYVWKEFVAQTISLKICKKNRIVPYTYTAADLSECFQKIVSTDMAAGDIGMFFAEFFTSQRGKSQNSMRLALFDCMNEQSDVIKDEIGTICDLLWPKFRKIKLKIIKVAFLEKLGEYVSELQEETMAEVIERYQNLTRDELENICLQTAS